MKPNDLKKTGMMCLVLLSLIPFFIQGQTLASTIKVANDSLLVDSLIVLSKNLFNADQVKSIEYAKEAIEIARKNKYYIGEAIALKNIGIVNYLQSNHVDALDYYTQSLHIYQSIKNESGISNIYSNIGVVYMERADVKKALDNYLESLKHAELAGDKYRTLIVLNNIGGAYDSELATRDKALETFLKAFNLAKELGKNVDAGDIAFNIGDIYVKKSKDSLALIYFESALTLYGDSDHKLFAYNGLAKIYRNQKKYDLALDYLNKSLAIANTEKNDLKILQTNQELGRTYSAKSDFIKALHYFSLAEASAKKVGNKLELKDTYERTAETYAQKKDFVNAYKYQKLFAALKDSISLDEVKNKLGSLQFEIDLNKKESEISQLNVTKALTEERLKKQQILKYALLAGLFLMLSLATILYRGYTNKQKTNVVLDKQKVEIESLLFNILPEEVAHELRQTGAATPRYYENVSVMFTDFKGFTALADQLSPQEVIAELDENFQAFDNIIDKYNLEKIKTIGDAYMCAAGIPTPQVGHYYQIMRAAIEIRDYIKENNRKRSLEGKNPWEIRIGIHIGPLVAGVVGKKKYAYDIWGNTVNIASRMETNVDPGQIAISSKAYEMVKDKFHCTYQGKINAKNVGDIDMYYLESEMTVSKLEFAA